MYVYTHMYLICISIMFILLVLLLWRVLTNTGAVGKRKYSLYLSLIIFFDRLMVEYLFVFSFRDNNSSSLLYTS